MFVRFPELILVVILILLISRRSTARTVGRVIGKVGSVPPRPEPARARVASNSESRKAVLSGYERYFAALDLTPSATQEEIQQAYRELAKVWHPDRFPNDPQLKERANAKLRDINEAYEKLRTRRPL